MRAWRRQGHGVPARVPQRRAVPPTYPLVHSEASSELGRHSRRQPPLGADEEHARHGLLVRLAKAPLAVRRSVVMCAGHQRGLEAAQGGGDPVVVRGDEEDGAGPPAVENVQLGKRLPVLRPPAAVDEGGQAAGHAKLLHGLDGPRGVADHEEATAPRCAEIGPGAVRQRVPERGGSACFHPPVLIRNPVWPGVWPGRGTASTAPLPRTS